jgi:ABC-type multidrug transport system ATPase subunit
MMEFESSQSPERSVLEVHNLWVRKGGLRNRKWILKGIDLDVKEGEFVAVIGPNGAGKTKLLEAILGDRPYAGQVKVFEQDLYTNPEHWLRLIGWVPVYNVLHDNLRVEDGLLQIGKLRLPERPEKAIKERIELLLQQLEFPEHRRGALIGELSSGERKRLDLCAELLTNPPLLFLDEPTTNLDPDAERSLMEMLRNRSWGKRQTVVVITHTLQSLYYCDRVIFLASGKVRAQGPYMQVLDQLEQELYEGARDLENQDDASRWAEIYRKSRQFVHEPLGEPPPNATVPEIRSRTHSKNWIHELRVLLTRNWLMFRHNFSALALYLLLGPFSGLLSRIVLRDNAFVQDISEAGYSSVFDTSDARQAIFILSLVVTLLGLIGSFLDVTKERLIYRYERVKGLSPWAYLLSKWLFLVALVGILAPSSILAVLTFQGQEIPEPYLVLVTLVLACIASVTLGLAISAAASSERTATGLLGIAVVFHLFFSGGVDFNERFRWLLDRISVFAASHWAAEGISSSTQLYCWAANPRFQDFYSWGHITSIWLNLVVYILLAMVLAFVALRMQDHWFPRKIRLQKAVMNRHVWSVIPLIVIAGSWAAFLDARSQEYYSLRSDQDNIRIENSVQANFFQESTGLVSQSLCPLPTELPPPATVMIAIPPTPFPTAIQDDSEMVNLQATAEPASTLEDNPVENQPVALVDTAVDSSSLPPLPTGSILSETGILFGPNHGDYPIEKLPANTKFTLLGKDLEERWFRIKEEATGRHLVGWVPIITTDLPVSKTGFTASPPQCAAPRAYLEGNQSSPTVEWTSDVNGHVVLVVDLFRDDAGLELKTGKLFVNINGEIVDTYPIQATRQSFIFRGLAIDIQVQDGDQLKLFFENSVLQDQLVRIRTSIYYVPSNCSF